MFRYVGTDDFDLDDRRCRACSDGSPRVARYRNGINGIRNDSSSQAKICLGKRSCDDIPDVPISALIAQERRASSIASIRRYVAA